MYRARCREKEGERQVVSVCQCSGREVAGRRRGTAHVESVARVAASH